MGDDLVEEDQTLGLDDRLVLSELHAVLALDDVLVFRDEFGGEFHTYNRRLQRTTQYLTRHNILSEVRPCFPGPPLCSLFEASAVSVISSNGRRTIISRWCSVRLRRSYENCGPLKSGGDFRVASRLLNDTQAQPNLFRVWISDQVCHSPLRPAAR